MVVVWGPLSKFSAVGFVSFVLESLDINGMSFPVKCTQSRFVVVFCHTVIPTHASPL